MKLIKAMCVAVVLISALTVSAAAYSPYQNYTYNADEKSNIEPQAYVPYDVIGRKELRLAMKEPQDIYIHKQDVYIADTGNHRVLITDLSFDDVRVLESFDCDGQTQTFKNPSGLFVTESGRLYVADTGNERILEFDENYACIRSINRPVTKLLPPETAYRPKRISVDTAGRIFVVCEDMSSGMIELDHAGNFVSFFGAVRTKPSFVDIMLRFFATESQKDRISLIIPTEYSSNDIDENGFVYGTVGIINPEKFDENMFIHRLNPIGNDILIREGSVAPMGDAEFKMDEQTNQIMPSMLTDVCVKECGLYTVLDRRFGRAFSYDQDGNLLYVFGALGTHFGQFKIPAAIDSFGDNFAVLDSELAQIVLFKPTEYGHLITDAVKSAYKRDYDDACEYWMQTLKYTSKSELSYGGVGDAMLNQKDYEAAMHYYKLGNNRKYYSVAFEQFRIDFMDAYFTWLIVGILVILCGIVIIVKIRKKRKGDKK